MLVHAASAASPAGDSTDPLDQVMLRGRIDVLVPTDDGYVMIDYKTDRIAADDVDARVSIHAPQLQLYRNAVECITGQPVSQVIVVFLHARRTKHL